MENQQHEFKVAHLIDGELRALIAPGELAAYLSNAPDDVRAAAEPFSAKPRKGKE